MAIKWKIHVNKQLGKVCWLYQILQDIRYMIKVQSWIASKNNRIEKHNDMWKEIEDYLT